MEYHETKKTSPQRWMPALVALTLFITIVNYSLLYSLPKSQTTVNIEQGKTATQNVQLMSAIIPQGIPDIYGPELSINFNDISSSNPQKADATIKRLAILDNQITLQGKELQRYIDIVSQISCEYCCGADSIITADGKPACGCAHSYAMRGLAKYLITKHPTEFTDNEILEELAKLKTLFFPGQMSKKAAVLQSKGIELTYTNLGSNKYRGIEASAGSGNSMVGGC